MFWIEMNSHWSINFQISFAISYFIFKHHVRNFWHLSCIEFDRWFDANHSFNRNRTIKCKSIKYDCNCIRFDFIKCRIQFIRQKYAKFHFVKSTDRDRLKSIHRRSYENVLKIQRLWSWFIQRHAWRFRKLQYRNMKIRFNKFLINDTQDLLHAKRLNQFIMRSERKTRWLHDDRIRFRILWNLNRKTNSTRKKKYKKFSSIIQKQWKKIKKRTTKWKITAISTFSNSNQRFENVIFIDSTTVSKTDFEHITKRHIEQSFDDASSADDLIDQSTKRNWKHLFAANNTISFVQNTRNQNFKFSSHRTTKRQSYEINWRNRFDQNLRDVKNDSLFA